MNQNFYNSNSFSFDQFQTSQYPVIHHPPQETSEEILQASENLMQSIQTFLKKFNRISFNETPNVLSRAWDKFFAIQHAQLEDIHELLRKLLEDLKIIREELAEYINSPSWNRLAFYNDDGDEYSIHTISETESDEVIKSSVEDLVPILSESKGILENMCDVPFSDKIHFDAESDLIESLLTRDTSIVYSPKIESLLEDEDDSFEDVNYVEASTPDSELVGLEEVHDDILHNSLPEFETFSDHTEETSSSSTTTQADNSLPEYDSFLFEIEPDRGELSRVVMETILREPHVYVPNVLPSHPTLYQDSDFSSSDDSLGSSREVSFPFGTRNKILIRGYSLKSNPRDFYHGILFLQHTIAIDFEASRARGFVRRPLEFQSLAYGNLIS
nr:hypothetical protein [Tanacetum cinerariifolium]